MICDKRVLGLIPARGGSKGLPRKNVLPLAGKPLIAWTIEAARNSRYIDRVIVSSDDEEIMKVAKRYDCEVPFRRPSELAEDDTPGIEPVLHALEEVPGFHYVVVLQPTSPLRSAEDIDAAVEACEAQKAPSCVSLVEVGKPLQWMFGVGPRGSIRRVSADIPLPSRRQEAAPVYALNGAVYVAEVEALRRCSAFVIDGTIGYVMPSERSVDIDTEFDLKWCEFLLK